MDAHDHHHDDPEDVHSWAGDFDPFTDAEERRVLFAALDSFRYVLSGVYCCRDMDLASSGRGVDIMILIPLFFVVNPFV